MYYEGEGEERKPVFEVGDAVRINAQDHPMCGYYGWIRFVDEVEGVAIGRTQFEVEGEMLVLALQSQVEAN